MLSLSKETTNGCRSSATDIRMNIEQVGFLKQFLSCRRRRISATILQSVFLSFFLFGVWTLLQSRTEITVTHSYDTEAEADYTEPSTTVTDRPTSKHIQSTASRTSQWARFDHITPENPKMVILLSYQRCGSTLLSQLFNSNPDAFYYFEPLDSLYSSLYGTSFGWNVPSDITSNNNGSRRELPKFEIKLVADFLSDLLRCKVDKLPMETLFHPYQLTFPNQFLSTADYAKCISHINGTLKQCRPQELSRFCGTRFNQMPEERMRDCLEMLKDPDNEGMNVTREQRNVFQQFEQCKKDLMDAARAEGNCPDLFRKSCTGKSLRAVKTVRATMDPIANLFLRHSNLRVIHLVRDPRGVTRSRFKLNKSVQSIYASKDTANDTDRFLVQEAEMFCRTVADDLRKKAIIEKKFPGRILTVVYDDFVTNAFENVKRIYEFLDIPLVDDRPFKALGVQEFLGGETKQVAPSSNASQEIAFKWHETVSYEVRLKILSVCKDFYSQVQHDWKL